MSESFLLSPGDVVDEAALSLPRAVGVLRAIRATGSWASLVECRRTEHEGVIVFDVEVERPQSPVNDIRRVERVAVVLANNDGVPPEVLALRADFPIVPHLSLGAEAKPRRLCLYDRPWRDVQPMWTPASLIERIRWWLARTARGELHEADQSLEPMMFSHGFDLIVPSRFGLAGGPSTLQVRLVLVDGKDGRVLVSDELQGPDRGGMECFVIYIETPPRTHGVIQRAPNTIADLAQLIDDGEFKIVPRLRELLWAIPDGIRTNPKRRRKVHLVFVLGLPKARRPGGEVEWVELKGFLCQDACIEAVGAAIDAWVVSGDDIALPLRPDDGRNGSDVKVVVVNVVRKLTWTRAALHSGWDRRDARRVVAIGAGALGSQVLMNLARGGFGTWTLIDDDAFMPHNAVRHALPGGFAIGQSKALCVAAYMNSLADDEPIAKAIAADYLQPAESKALVEEAIGQAEFVLDMSASVPVSRALADADPACRAASMFLSPDGHDLALLTEDPGRSIRLDDLEMLYYAQVGTREDLSGHLDSPASPARYGTSCRDVSISMGQCGVGTLAGVGASAVMQDSSRAEASIRVWRLSPSTLAVQQAQLDVLPFHKSEQHGWRVCVSRGLLTSIAKWRNERLPNETGGILLGGVDHARRCIHVVLAVPSPPDSEEWPTMYIRGVKGLRQFRERIVKATAGNIDYLGEWHSHPPRASTLPSNDDRQVFGWIHDLVAIDDRPPVMLIAGDEGARVFVGELDPVPAEL